MATDIDGWVEVRPVWSDTWFPVIRAGLLLGRNYSSFGSLFGVRSDSGFAPVAPDRGIPDDTSDTVKADAIDCHSPTWITWAELQEIDWEESVVDPFVHRFGWNKKTGEWIPVVSTLPSQPHGRPAGESWQEGKTLCKAVLVTRRDIRDHTFTLLFEMMATLAKEYQPENIRLTVYFDG